MPIQKNIQFSLEGLQIGEVSEGNKVDKKTQAYYHIVTTWKIGNRFFIPCFSIIKKY